MKSFAILSVVAGAAASAGAYYDTTTTSTSTVGYTTVAACPKCHHPASDLAQTVTKQYQPVTTCQAAAVTACAAYTSGVPQSCTTYDVPTSCSTYAYVSTVIPAHDGQSCTVTETAQPVTVCSTRSTITHSSTSYSPAAPTAHRYSPGPFALNNVTAHVRVWYELYEKTCEVPYNQLGPIAIPGYGGSGLCGRACRAKGRDHTKYQPVEIKECFDGRCNRHTYTYVHGAPKPSVTTYKSPGTYTITAYDVTVTKTTTIARPAFTVVQPNQQVTYGGVITSVPRPTTLTVACAEYKTQGGRTKTIIKYVTQVCASAGRYTIVKPTVTSCATETTIAYPTVTVYVPGVYHHTQETVTITKSNQAYTCDYQQTDLPTGTTTGAGPDPSSDAEEPAEAYGKAEAGYVKRGGMIRRNAGPASGAKPLNKRVILV